MGVGLIMGVLLHTSWAHRTVGGVLEAAGSLLGSAVGRSYSRSSPAPAKPTLERASGRRREHLEGPPAPARSHMGVGLRLKFDGRPNQCPNQCYMGVELDIGVGFAAGV